MRDARGRGFAKQSAEQLKTGRRLWRAGESTRRAEAANAANVPAEREIVPQIHSQQVIRLFGDLERGRRQGR